MSITVLNDIAYGNHERQKVDIYIPENAKSACGLILYIHGGGWQEGDKSGHKPDCEHFCNLGYITAATNYRFVAEDISIFNELDDISAAIKTIKSKLAEYNYNLQKVILSGGSAGAHLALMYAYTRSDHSALTPVAACVYCPPVDCSKPDFLLGISGEFESWKYEILSKCASSKITKETYSDNRQQSSLKQMSPYYYVDFNCVPTAVFHGKNDELIPLEHIEEFIKKLNEKEIKNDFLLYEKSGHALNKDPEANITAKKIIEEYAKTYF